MSNERTSAPPLFAILGPPICIAIALSVLVAFAGGVSDAFWFLERGAFFAYATLAVAGLGLLGVIAVLLIGESRTSVALGLLAGALPWVVGIAMTWRAGENVAKAVEAAEPSSLPVFRAAGTSESLVSRFVGTSFSAALLVALALGFALATLRGPVSRPRLWRAGGFAATGLVAGALLWTPIYLVTVATDELLLLCAAGSALALGVAGYGAGSDRKGATAFTTGACVAVVLGVFAALASVATGGAYLALEGFRVLEPPSTTVLDGAAIVEISRSTAALGAFGFGALASGVAWLGRGPSPIGWLSVMATIPVALVLPLADHIVAEDLLARLEVHAPLLDAEAFESCEITSPRLGAARAVVRADGVVVVEGATATLTPSESASEDVRELLSRLDGDLNLAVDRRLPGPLLRALLASARETGARSVWFVGTGPEAARGARERKRLRAAVPWLSGAFEDTRTVHAPLYVENDWSPQSDRLLYHGTLDGARELVVRTRLRAPRPGFTIGDPRDPLSRTRALETAQAHGTVYLSITDSATAGDVVARLGQLADGPLLPELVVGPVPGRPDLTYDEIVYDRFH